MSVKECLLCLGIMFDLKRAMSGLVKQLLGRRRRSPTAMSMPVLRLKWSGLSCARVSKAQNYYVLVAGEWTSATCRN